VLTRRRLSGALGGRKSLTLGWRRVSIGRADGSVGNNLEAVLAMGFLGKLFTRKPYRVIKRTGYTTDLVMFGPDGNWLTAFVGGDSVSLVDADSGAVVRSLSTLKALPQCLAVSPDGKWVAGGVIDPNAVIVWDARTGQPGPGVTHVWADSVEFSPDAKWFAVGEHGGTVYLFPMPAATSDKTITLGTHSEKYARDVPAVKFSPDGAFLISASVNGTVRIWNLSTRAEVKCLQMAEPHDLAISPSGKVFAVACGDGHVRVFNLPGGQSLRAIKISDDRICSVAISPDGKWLASDGGGRNGLVVTEFESGRRVFESDGHVNRYLTFHPCDSTVLVTACNALEKDDGGVRRWNLPLR